MEIVLFVIQFLTLVALIVYVIKTWEMASATKASAMAAERTLSELREARDQETAPYVVVYFEVPYAKNLVFLVVKNLGRTMARDVKLGFEPSLKTSDLPDLEGMPLFADGISSLAPQQEIRVLLDTTVAFFGQPGRPLTYAVSISFLGGISDEPRSITHKLDLSVHKGLMYILVKDMHNLNETLEKLLREAGAIRRSLEQVSQTLDSGIFLNNPTLTVSGISMSQREWQASLFAKLQEYVMLWETVPEGYPEKETERGRMKHRILLISSQVLTLLAVRPEDVSSQLVSEVQSLAAELQKLGRFRFYADGGTSLRKYSERGDELTKQIASLVARTSILVPGE